MSNVLAISGLHGTKPREEVQVNALYHFKVEGVKHIAPTSFTDHKGRFGSPGETITSHAGVVRFRLTPVDEDTHEQLPNTKAIPQSFYLADEDYMDEQQMIDANRQFKSVLVLTGVEIGEDDVVNISDMEGAVVELRTRGYVDGKNEERVDVSWPEFRE